MSGGGASQFVLPSGIDLNITDWLPNAPYKDTSRMLFNVYVCLDLISNNDLIITFAASIPLGELCVHALQSCSLVDASVIFSGMFEVASESGSNSSNQFEFGYGGFQGGRGASSGGPFFVENVIEEWDYTGNDIKTYHACYAVTISHCR